jgi:histidinol-phosphatase
MKDDIDKIVQTVNKTIEKSNALLIEQCNNGIANPHSFDSKDDLSPVTETDKQIETEIRKIIAEEHPDHGVIGEELGVKNNESSAYKWIIDPIDGTQQFIRGMRFFGTQIAVMRESQIIVGASNAPLLSERIMAVKNEGTKLNGRPIQVSSIDKLDMSFFSHGEVKFFAQTNKLQQLIHLCKNSWGNRGFGDFWSYHLIAQGKIEAMLEAQTSIWDIAAVSLIVTEAGGVVSDFAGNPIDEKSTSIVASNARIHDLILTELQRV